VRLTATSVQAHSVDSPGNGGRMLTLKILSDRRRPCGLNERNYERGVLRLKSRISQIGLSKKPKIFNKIEERDRANSDG
jgi:hypothetical protein